MLLQCGVAIKLTNKPPAKLLERLYSQKTGRRYKKVSLVKELFGRLDPNVAYGKCPRLRELLDKMLELAEDIVKRVDTAPLFSLHRPPIAGKHTDNNTSQAYLAVRGREAQTGGFIFSEAIRALN
ncbi:MAG: hypothetical protein ACYDAI_05805 [Trichloromonadaceae bacterium]